MNEEHLRRSHTRQVKSTASSLSAVDYQECIILNSFVLWFTFASFSVSCLSSWKELLMSKIVWKFLQTSREPKNPVSSVRENNSSESRDKYKRLISTLKQCRLAFDYICQAEGAINEAFSFPLFVVLSTRLVTTCWYFFFFIYFMTKPTSLLSGFFPWYMLLCFVVDCSMIASVFAPADLPVNKVKSEHHDCVNMPDCALLFLHFR